MLYSRRNLGIDLIKIIACVQVVMLHNFVKYFDGTVNTTTFVKIFTELIYFGGSTAIPLFFMANGYFVLNKSKLNFYYWVKKSKSILEIVIAWIFLYSLKDLMSIHKVTFFTYLYGTFLSKQPFNGFIYPGVFYHFWFFWSLIIVLALAPFLNKLLRSSTKKYVIILVFLTITCVCINILSYILKRAIDQNIIQVFRIHIWLMYYMYGGLLGKFKNNIKGYFVNHCHLNNYYLVIAFLGFYTAFILIAFKFNRILGTFYTEYNYTNILLIFSSVLLFILLSNKMEFKNSFLNKFVSFVAPLTMGIYIIHPFIITKVYAVINLNTLLGSLIVFLTSLLASATIVFIMKKIPFLKFLVKL